MNDINEAAATKVAEKIKDWRPVMLLFTAIVILLDRLTKHIIKHHLSTGDAIVLIPGWLRITHVMNNGAAFSLFADSASPAFIHRALVGFSLFAVVILCVLLWQSGPQFSRISLAFAIVLGGALGNMYDRIRYIYVTDFIEVHIYRFHWPDFNLADSAIVIGACLLVLEMLRPPAPEHGQPTRKI
jgi:signal peptidase II